MAKIVTPSHVERYGLLGMFFARQANDLVQTYLVPADENLTIQIFLLPHPMVSRISVSYHQKQTISLDVPCANHTCKRTHSNIGNHMLKSHFPDKFNPTIPSFPLCILSELFKRWLTYGIPCKTLAKKKSDDPN